MEAENDPLTPLSMTLMGGPIDTRVADRRQQARRGARDRVVQEALHRQGAPAHPGFWRDVYPGFLQLSGFMAMNIDRHMTAHHGHVQASRPG